MTRLKIACLAVAITSLLMVAFVGRSSSPVPAPVVASDAPEWPRPTEEQMAAARKELAAAMAMFTEGPRIITTETITPTPAPLAKEREVKVVLPPVEKPKKSDVCTRHKMIKVKVGRYRWRCKKA